MGFIIPYEAHRLAGLLYGGDDFNSQKMLPTAALVRNHALADHSPVHRPRSMRRRSPTRPRGSRVFAGDLLTLAPRKRQRAGTPGPIQATNR